MKGRRVRVRRPGASDEGQALVEFALVVPFLLVLLLGIFEVARAWQAYQVVTDAAREGARNAVVDDPSISSDSVKATVRNALVRAALDPARIDSLGVTGFRTGRGNPTEVYLAYEHEWIWLKPLLGWVGAQGTINLKSNIVMRQE